MSFADVIGHKRVIDILQGACRRDKLHHAYLFSGPEGVGKELVAFQLFKRLNCTGGGNDACDDCPTCRKLDADAETSRLIEDGEEVSYTFPDLQVLHVLPKKKTIAIDQVREITRHLAYAPVAGRWKCVLIRDAHRLHPTAANALLKTLEEPPPATLFVLVSHATHLLLPTIISRCQPVRFGPLSREDVARYLVGHTDLDAQSAIPVAAMADGSVGRALELVQNPVVVGRREWLTRFRSLEGAPPHAILELSDLMSAERDDLPFHLNVLRTWYRDQLLLHEGLPNSVLTNLDLADLVTTAAANTNRSRLLSQLDLIDEAERALEGNANTLLTMDWLLIQLFST